MLIFKLMKGPYLQVLDELARSTSGRKWRVDALGRKVVQLLEEGVHDDLLLVGVLEGLHARQCRALPGDDVGAAAEPGNVPAQNVQQHRLRYVIRIVPCKSHAMHE